MSRLGVVDLLGLGTTLVFALPIGAFGVQLLLEGQTALGLAGILVAVGLVVVERFIWTPADVFGDLTERIVGLVVERPREDREDA